MSSYIITGCSRGIGLELVKQSIAAPTSTVSIVFATARSHSPPPALKNVIDSARDRAHFVELDVTSDQSIAGAAKEIARLLGDYGLDVLVNNAGLQIHEPGGVGAMHGLERTLNTNVVAVHKVSAALLLLLFKGSGKKIINISSTLGSIAMNGLFAGYPVASYKISKTALNMLTVQYANDLGPKGLTVFCISPGNLQTDIGGGEHAELPIEAGVQAVLDIIYNSTQRDNGFFRNISIPGIEHYDGLNPPW